MTSTAQVVKQTTTTAKPNLIPMMVYNLAQSKIQEVANPMKKFHEEESPFTPIMAIPLWHSNPRLLLLPHPQPHQPEKTLHGQILYQPLSICLLQGHCGQFSLTWMKSQCPFLSKQKRQRRRPHLNKQLSPVP